MALFADDEDTRPPNHRGAARVGGFMLSIALVGAIAFSLVPSPYVIEQPGPVFDTLGTVTIDKAEVPMISISTEPTYPTSGTLDLLTINVVGNPEQLPNWFEVVSAWFSPSRAVVPVTAVFPAGSTVQQSDELGAAAMANSQKEAIAAALIHLGKQVNSTVSVVRLTSPSPATGILKPGDKILAAGGSTVRDVDDLRAAIGASGVGKPLTVQIARAGVTQTVTIIPAVGAGSTAVPVIGIEARVDFMFPFEVKIQLDNVGGPSAGQMFALGIIDKLTPGSLTGGKRIAGTGTVDASGKVGTIGGIRQKLYGARQAGAKWFLAPSGNCDEVRGHIPAGLTVLAVRNLDDSLAALRAISSDASTSGLPTCAVP